MRRRLRHQLGASAVACTAVVFTATALLPASASASASRPDAHQGRRTVQSGAHGRAAGQADPRTGPVAPIRARGPFLTDRFGRVTLLHGADLVYKLPPYEVVVGGRGHDVLTPVQAKRMASLGFDVVRLGILWKGLEPGTARMNDPRICGDGPPRRAGPGQFSASVLRRYLHRLDSTIALLARYGIYSLLDMHQDVYSEVFGGEGAPNWAVCTDGIAPEPRRGVPDWSVNLQGPGVVQAYEHFWRNDVAGDLQGAFDAVWAKVARHYRDDPWVIGYDPFNEPYGQGLPPAADGTAFDAELECFYTGRADPGVDQSGHPVTCPADDPEVGLVPRIEAADPNHLVFYEDNYTTDASVPSHIGPMPFPRLVVNTHDYCFLHVPNGPEPAGFGATCGPLEEATFATRNTERQRDATPDEPGGLPLVLTEFGATTDVADLARVTADADTNLVGWMYWQWLHYDDPTGSHSSGLWPPTKPTRRMLEVLSRTYARAVAGTPTAMSFDPSSGRFSLAYRPDHAITEPTVVFVPVTVHYRHGYCARVAGGRVTSRRGARSLDVVAAAGSTDVTVTVTPGRC